MQQQQMRWNRMVTNVVEDIMSEMIDEIERSNKAKISRKKKSKSKSKSRQESNKQAKTIETVKNIRLNENTASCSSASHSQDSKVECISTDLLQSKKVVNTQSQMNLSSLNTKVFAQRDTKKDIDSQHGLHRSGKRYSIEIREQGKDSNSFVTFYELAFPCVFHVPFNVYACIIFLCILFVYYYYYFNFYKISYMIRIW